MSMESNVRLGVRLRMARKRAGLTQQEFADALGLRHRQTVASIEAGERRASAQELIRAMEVLSVDLDYFTDPFRLVGEGQFSFRTSPGVEEEVLDRFERRAGRWLAMYRELSREQGDRPRWLGYKLNLSASSSVEDAQAAGESAVKLWELGDRPAPRLRSVLEDRLHILVLYVDAPSGISGAASRLSGLNCALVNRRESEGRRNLGLARQLFHLLTWDALPPERTIADDKPPRGKRWRAGTLAEHFASALLMPAAIVKRAWGAMAAIRDGHRRVNEVAGEMGVSSLACKRRLRRLGLLSTADVKAIDDRLLVATPALDCWPGEVPPFSREFIRKVATALEAGRLSARRAAEVLATSVEGLARILRAYGHETDFEA